MKGSIIMKKLVVPLDAHGNEQMAKRYLKGGFGQDGFGVPEGAAVNGSFTFSGTQGYYADGPEAGKKVFTGTVEAMKRFFQQRTERLGKPIRCVIKPGIGGQHTPFQGIADAFAHLNEAKGKRDQVFITGEYELGKDYEAALQSYLKKLEADWDQVVLIPSSKSGSTDETMLIFVDLLAILLKKIAEMKGVDGAAFSKAVLELLHEINFVDGKERPGRDLFKMDPQRFGTNFIEVLAARLKSSNVSVAQVRDVLGIVLGNMFFETTDRPEASRLSAFIRNSGLDRDLGQDAPGFGAMFDNVGGRWTGDLHMMTFLAFFDLDPAVYWQVRWKGILEVREGRHAANVIAKQILDHKVRDIALLVPDELYWFGKAIEQNFNESIWQEGFANLIAVRVSDWNAQRGYYRKSRALVINLSRLSLSSSDFQEAKLEAVDCDQVRDGRELANIYARLFTTFYGITSNVGNALIENALAAQSLDAASVDLNNLDLPATQILRANLYLLQPYVELGKGLLENKLKALQEKTSSDADAVSAVQDEILSAARMRTLKSNSEAIGTSVQLGTKKELEQAVLKISEAARKDERKLVPFIYLDGTKFYDLRDQLIRAGVPWVMQGTGDQHISYQQVLAQPQRFLPFLVSFVSQDPIPGRPAVGFAKGYLHQISPHMVRDFFAEASYQALVGDRAQAGGLGVFLRLLDTDLNRFELGSSLAAAFK